MFDPTTSVGNGTVTESAAPKKGIAAFIGTTSGKIIAVALVVVLFIAIAAGAYFVLMSPAGNQSGRQNPGRPTAGKGASQITTTAGAAPIVEPARKPLSSTFTFRNVFAPTISAPKPPTVTGGTETGAGTSTGSGTTADNTLFLQSISTENGTRKAVFGWNGTTYTLAEGEQVDSSPWKVLEINSDSVVMLFGDTRITLSTGQGITK